MLCEQGWCFQKIRDISWPPPLHCHSWCITTTTCNQWITLQLRITEHLKCQVSSVGCIHCWCNKEIITPEKKQKGCVGKHWSSCAWSLHSSSWANCARRRFVKKTPLQNTLFTHWLHHSRSLMEEGTLKPRPPRAACPCLHSLLDSHSWREGKL